MAMNDENGISQGPSPREGSDGLDISAVVPVFNEEDSIDHLYERLSSVMEEYGRSYEILFVDDGSRDSSFAKLKALHDRDPRVRVVRFVRNFGQQMAVSAGFLHLRGDAVVLLDADLQNFPEDVPLLLDKLAEGYDIVYGVRQRRVDSLLRRAGSWCMSHLLYRITGIDVPDSASGFIALDRRFVESIKLYNEKSKYFSGLFAWLSYGRWASVQVRHQARHAGESKYSLFKLAGLTLNFVCNFSDLPLRLATYAGAALMGLGALGLLTAAIIELVSSAIAVSTGVLVAFGALFTGLQLAAIGIVGEYLSRIYSEVRERPHFVVGEVLDHDPVT
ncbi:MAG: glycosyltransferase family 2 protein [bacterium]|nr:glycosyltransferase family 2 protein [bacterium]